VNCAIKIIDTGLLFTLGESRVLEIPEVEDDLVIQRFEDWSDEISLKLKVYNNSATPKTFKKGDRITRFIPIITFNVGLTEITDK